LRKGHKAGKAIYLSSAKNEFESFEIIIAPYGRMPLKGVEIAFEDLVSDGARIGKEKIMCYVMGDRGSQSDVLFPYNSFWSIMARQRVASAQSFWVTTYVPATAKAGIYGGKMQVATRNAGSQNIELRLRIWDFLLPERMHLKTHFMMKRQDLRSLYPRLSGAQLGETIFRYRVNVAEHRVSSQGNIAPPFRIVGRERVLPHYREFDGDMSALTKLGLNAYCLHLSDMEPHIDISAFPKVLSKLQGHLERRHWLDLAYLHLEDGPQRLALRSQAELAKRASPGIKLVAEANGSEGPSGLAKIADIWVVDGCRSGPRSLSALLRGRGEVWLDGACKHGRHGPLCRHRERVDIRKTFWRMWSMGMRGLVYDSALPTARSKEPLLHAWEEGILNSARWEVIRDGIEDFEYLSLLEGAVSGSKGAGKSMAPIQRRAIKLLRDIRAKGAPVNLARAREGIAAVLEAYSAGASES
jgi:hypothetical protein